MKKIISLLLVLIMTFSLALPASAAMADGKKVPIIVLRGDGTDIYDKTGEKIVWPVSLGDEEGDKDKLIDSIIDVIFPHLVTGLLTGNYDGYYEAFYQAVLPLFDEALLDGSGNPIDGTQIDPSAQATNAERRRYNTIGWGGEPDRYNMGEYTFYYDWRLSPYDTAEKLDAYIADVMRVTGSDEINLVGLCLGGIPVLAYLDMYLDKLAAGTKPYIKNVMFDTTVAFGCDVFTDAFRGKIDLDSNGMQRFLDQYMDPDEASFDGLGDMAVMVNELVFTTYELLRETTVTDQVFGSAEEFYAVIAGGLVPKLAIASYGSFPGYWGSIKPEYYEEARDYVFGKPGDEMYEEYKVMIEKMDKFHKEVSSQMFNIIDECKANGTHFGTVAKYGYQHYPFIESQNKLADGLISLESATAGATCSLVGETLTDAYIAERIEKGYGDFISADKQVDLSTSYFAPTDTVWVIKNAIHDDFAVEKRLVENFCWGKNETVATLKDKTVYERFMLFTLTPDEYDSDVQNADDYLVPLVDDNKDETLWDDTDVGQESTIWTKLAALFRWLTAMLKFILRITAENPGPAPV